jgi:hypothetical protein
LFYHLRSTTDTSRTSSERSSHTERPFYRVPAHNSIAGALSHRKKAQLILYKHLPNGLHTQNVLFIVSLRITVSRELYRTGTKHKWYVTNIFRTVFIHRTSFLSCPCALQYHGSFIAQERSTTDTLRTSSERSSYTERPFYRVPAHTSYHGSFIAQERSTTDTLQTSSERSILPIQFNMPFFTEGFWRGPIPCAQGHDKMTTVYVQLWLRAQLSPTLVYYTVFCCRPLHWWHGHSELEQSSSEKRRGVYSQGQYVFLLSSACRTLLGPTQPTIQWVSEVLSKAVKQVKVKAAHDIPKQALRRGGGTAPSPSRFTSWKDTIHVVLNRTGGTRDIRLLSLCPFVAGYRVSFTFLPFRCLYINHNYSTPSTQLCNYYITQSCMFKSQTASKTTACR